jgi:hypothetical protein
MERFWPRARLEYTKAVGSWGAFASRERYMHKRHKSRLLAAPALLAALLLLAAVVLGGVWHSHNGTSSDTCQICHFNHQPVAQDLAISRVCTPIFVGTIPIPADAIGVAGPSIILAVPRAPPVA